MIFMAFPGAEWLITIMHEPQRVDNSAASHAQRGRQHANSPAMRGPQ
jgi:hypothetical protein